MALDTGVRTGGDSRRIQPFGIAKGAFMVRSGRTPTVTLGLALVAAALAVAGQVQEATSPQLTTSEMEATITAPRKTAHAVLLVGGIITPALQIKERLVSDGGG